MIASGSQEIADFTGERAENLGMAVAVWRRLPTTPDIPGLTNSAVLAHAYRPVAGRTPA
jgi:hypothetical protein